ncbi:MAG TPA: hypothetical protein VF066_00265 [Thermoleophilaceae bacterium]
MRTRLALLAALAVAAFPSTALADDAPACLAAKGPASDGQSMRGVHVGGRAVIRGTDGNPLTVSSVSYCVEGGGVFSFALSTESDVVLALSTSDGDAIGEINPTSPAESARLAFPKMTKLARTTTTSVYRVDRRQLILGVAGGRVNFVAAADRLLLEYPHKLGYYLKRLGF